MPVLIALQPCGKFFNCFRGNYLEESILIFLPCKIAVENNKQSPPNMTSCWAIHQQELWNQQAVSRHQLKRLCAVVFTAISIWVCSPAKWILVSLTKSLASRWEWMTLLARGVLCCLLSLAALWVVLWLDTIFLLAGLDGETEGNKVLLIYSPAGVYEPLVVPPLGAEMLSHGRAP